MSAMSKSLKKKNHWTNKVHEAVLTRNKEGELGFDLKGGAENGNFPYFGEVKQGKVAIQSGKLSQDELLLEVNDTPVAGLTTRDVLAVIKHCKDPFRLKCVKQGEDKHQCAAVSLCEREREKERPLRCLGLLSAHYSRRNPVYTQRCISDPARDRCGYRLKPPRTFYCRSLQQNLQNVMDCHRNMSVKFELCLGSTDRGIMREGAGGVPPRVGDILARGSAMGELGEYLKAISLIS